MLDSHQQSLAGTDLLKPLGMPGRPGTALLELVLYDAVSFGYRGVAETGQLDLVAGTGSGNSRSMTDDGTYFSALALKVDKTYFAIQEPILEADR